MKNRQPRRSVQKALTEATRAGRGSRAERDLHRRSLRRFGRHHARLPQVSRRMTRDEILLARGTADALAMKLRHHDAGTTCEIRPPARWRATSYEAMETAVARRSAPHATCPGAQQYRCQDRPLRPNARATARSNPPPRRPGGGGGLYPVAQKASGRPLPPAAQRVADLWRPFVEEQAGADLEHVNEVLDDQGRPSRGWRARSSPIWAGDQLGEDPDEPQEDDDRRECRAGRRIRRQPVPRPERGRGCRASPNARRIRPKRNVRPRSAWTTSPTRKWPTRQR